MAVPSIVSVAEERELNRQLVNAASKCELGHMFSLFLQGATDLNTALAKVAGSGCIEIIPELIKWGATDLTEAMVHAAWHDQWATIRFLSDLAGPNADYTRVLVAAASENHGGLFPTLVAKGGDPNKALVEAAAEGHLEAVQMALSMGATDVNTALVEAAFYGYLDIVKLMLFSGAYELRKARQAARKGTNDPDVIQYIATFQRLS